MSDVIQKGTKYGVRTVGTGVEMFIGGASITMGYEEALNLGLMLRGAGREAKANAGDVSRRFRVSGVLTPAKTLHVG